MNKVFISYSHKDKDWVKNWFLPSFEADGFQTYIDYRDFEIGIPALTNMERAVETCAKTILVCSPHYVESEFSQLEAIMLQTEDPIGLRKKIIPLMLDDCQLPKRLKIFSYADFRDRKVWEFQLRRLKDQIKKDFEATAEKLVYTLPDQVDTIRLPETGFELFGRQKELKLLHDAWESDQINVISFIAYGGTGKSTLVNKWLEKMRWDNFCSAKRVYAWSFYSQGTGEQVTSADQFINHALNFFGDPDPAQGSPWDKGKRLANLIRADKTLLILDGLEPLQSGLRFEYGKITDPALSVLVSELAKANHGLCVITSRVEVAEMLRYPSSERQVDLEQISDEAGRALLRVRGVRGTDAELENVTRTFGNHALAINLLAEYLYTIPNHPSQAAHQIPNLDIPEKEGKYPRRVMEEFASQFGEGAELELLCVLGLFDRPANKAAIDAVIQGESIKGLTAHLSQLSESDWLRLLKKLRDYKLIARESKHRPDAIDCHPLIREHFGQKLRSKTHRAWHIAHERLYEYYKNLPRKELPDTLEELEPLFAAVAHGCQAGRYQEAYNNVYFPIISREYRQYIKYRFGAIGINLTLLANFFATPFSDIVSELPDKIKAYILDRAGSDLQDMGRLNEATELMQKSLYLYLNSQNWHKAAEVSGNLSDLFLTKGELGRAKDQSLKSVELADKSNNNFMRSKQRTKYGNILLHGGDTKNSEFQFKKAEALHSFHATQADRYYILLLTQGKYNEILKRVPKTLEMAKVQNWIVNIGLDHLAWGFANLLQKMQEKNYNLSQIENRINLALNNLRRAGQQQYLFQGLYTRAIFFRIQRKLSQAYGDIEEAREIAERGEMKLWLVDYHLEASRLISSQLSLESDQSAVSTQQSAVGSSQVVVDESNVTLNKNEMVDRLKMHLEQADKLVKKTGYHRRDPEVELGYAELFLAQGDKVKAQERLARGKYMLEEMGIRCWDFEVRRLEKVIG